MKTIGDGSSSRYSICRIAKKLEISNLNRFVLFPFELLPKFDYVNIQLIVYIYMWMLQR